MQKINYKSLNCKQKELYNYQKISAVFADYGFICIKLIEDTSDADFLLKDMSTRKIIHVQQKARFTINKEYLGKKIFICFRHGDKVYLYPHDVLVKYLKKINKYTSTSSWLDRGGFSTGMNKVIASILSKYIIGSQFNKKILNK